MTTGSDSPVFIVGAERSGTSILYRAIQQHPRFSPAAVRSLVGSNVSYASGVSLTESHVFTDPRNIFSTRSLAFEYLLKDAQRHADLMRDVPVLKRWQTSLLGDVLYKVYFKYHWLLVWKLLGNPRLIRRYFSHAIEARGVGRLVEKTPTSIRRLETITTTYPDARLLFIHRHPVHVLSSMRRRSAAEYRASGRRAFQGLVESTDAFVAYYAGYMHRALQARRENGNFLMLKYESLVDAPDKCLASVFDFIGESWSKDLLPDDDSALSKWDRDPYLFREITRTPGASDGGGHVTADEARAVERGLEEYMEVLGYDSASDDAPAGRERTP